MICLKPLIYSILGVGLLIPTALHQGHRIGRWGATQELESAANRIQAIPAQFGDWRGEDLDLDPRHARIAEIENAIVRNYSNQRTGEHYQVLVVCGRPGPISVHTPEICYAGLGYESEGVPLPMTLDPKIRTEFRVARFVDPTGKGKPLHIYWCWSDGGAWRAPENPRVTYSSRKWLYKLYVVREALDTSSLKDSADRSFLSKLLAEIQVSLGDPS